MTPLQTNKHVAAATILERAVCLRLERHYAGNDRHVDLAEVVEAAAPDREEPDAGLAVDAEQFSVSMKLVPQKAIRPVMHALNEAERFLERHAIKAHRVFGERSYLIPVDLVEEVEAGLARIAAAVWVEAGKLADAYEALAEAQRAKVGRLAADVTYPTKERVRAAFSIDWDFVSFEAPDRLRTISRAVAERARSKAERRMASAYDDVVATLRGEALGVLTDLEARLDAGDGERPKVLRGEPLKALEDYVRLLPARNLGGDDALAAGMARVARLAAGVTREQLKDDAGLRASLHAAAAAAKATLAALVEEAPVRSISFGRIGSAA